MRKILIMALLSLCIINTSFALGTDEKKITLRNYTNTPMRFFMVETENMEYFSDLARPEDYSNAALIDKHNHANIYLHAVEYPASFSFTVIIPQDSADEVTGAQNVLPVCVIGSVRLSSKDAAFGDYVFNYPIGDVYKCKVALKSIVSIHKIFKSPFSKSKK